MEENTPTFEASKNITAITIAIAIIIFFAIISIMGTDLPTSSTEPEPKEESIWVDHSKLPGSPLPNAPYDTNACLQWYEVTEEHVGTTQCVMGTVAMTEFRRNKLLFGMFFGDQAGDFSMFIRSIFDKKGFEGHCVVTAGEIENNQGYLTLPQSLNQFYNCDPTDGIRPTITPPDYSAEISLPPAPFDHNDCYQWFDLGPDVVGKELCVKGYVRKTFYVNEESEEFTALVFSPMLDDPIIFVENINITDVKNHCVVMIGYVCDYDRLSMNVAIDSVYHCDD